MKNKRILIAYKAFFGLLGFSAIVTEVATIVEKIVKQVKNRYNTCYAAR